MVSWGPETRNMLSLALGNATCHGWENWSQNKGLWSWLVNLPCPNVTPKKEGLIRGLLTFGFP